MKPRTLFTEILIAPWKHGGELAVAVGGITAIGVAALLTRSLLHLQAFSRSQVVFALVALVCATMMFVAAVSAWRLDRKQRLARATTHRERRAPR